MCVLQQPEAHAPYSCANSFPVLHFCLLSFCLPADAAACVSFSSLKHMLNSQDALLGPWLPGRDMLEDELRTFVGE